MSNTTKKPNVEKTQPPLSTADKISAGIRKALFGKFGEPDDKSMPSRLTLAVSDWLKSRHPEDYSGALSEFTFTSPGQPFKKIWKVPLEIDDLYDGDKVIKYPALNPTQTFFPPLSDTHSILCFGRLAVIDVSTGEAICVSDFSNVFFYINKIAKERIHRVKATGSNGNLTIVYMHLCFCRMVAEDKPLVDNGESSGLIAAIYRK